MNRPSLYFDKPEGHSEDDAFLHSLAEWNGFFLFLVITSLCWIVLDSIMNHGFSMEASAPQVALAISGISAAGIRLATKGKLSSRMSLSIAWIDCVVTAAVLLPVL